MSGIDEAIEARMRIWRADDPRPADIVTLKVRKAVAPERFQDFLAYPVKEGTLLPTRVQTRGTHAERRLPGGASVKLGDHPIANELRRLGVWRFAVGRIYTPRAESFLHPEFARVPV